MDEISSGTMEIIGAGRISRASGETRRRSVGLSAGADQNSAWILNNKELCVARPGRRGERRRIAVEVMLVIDDQRDAPGPAGALGRSYLRVTNVSVR